MGDNKSKNYCTSFDINHCGELEEAGICQNSKLWLAYLDQESDQMYELYSEWEKPKIEDHPNWVELGPIPTFDEVWEEFIKLATREEIFSMMSKNLGSFFEQTESPTEAIIMAYLLFIDLSRRKE